LKNIKENFQVKKEGEFEIGDRKTVKEKDRNLKRQETRWLLPSEGWSKANFESASKGNPSPSRSGKIIRNNFREGVAAFSLPLGFQSN
jgi:hypothetical protein